MNYLKYKFINKPSLADIISNNALFIGPTGSGKSVLLHQFIGEINDVESLRDCIVYVHDPKMVEFRQNTSSIVNGIITSQNEESFIRLLKDEISLRKQLLETENSVELQTIVIISDEIGASILGFYLLSIFAESSKYKIALILAAQNEQEYFRDKHKIGGGVIFHLEGSYKSGSRSIKRIT